MSAYGMVSNEVIPDGYRGTQKTIALMREMARMGALDERVRRLATLITQNVRSKDYTSEAAALLAWVQKNVRYVRDPWVPDGAERVQHPVVTLLEERCGDCDDASTALDALWGSIGGGYGWRTVGTDPMRPNDFSHVYSLLYLEDRGLWATADPIFPGRPLGWEPPDAVPNGRMSLAAQPGRVAWRKNWMA